MNKVQLRIETASNGWIVTGGVYYYGRIPEVLAVFNKLEDLQAALPTLLKVEQKEPASAS